MLPNDYYDEWDRLIKDWYNNASALSAFIGRGLSLNYLPEPFYGDMENCSLVVINLNPGKGLSEQHWNSQNTLGTIANDVKITGYSAYAKSFPLLSGKGPTPSVNWWEERNCWLDRILGFKGVKTDKNPFAIELVPLHSASFRISNPSGYVAGIQSINHKLDVIAAIEYGVLHSDAQFGVAVGRPIRDTLVNNGFSPVCAPYPPLAGKKRYYEVLEKKGIKILCTWAQGSNKAPASHYVPSEDNLVKTYL